MSLSRTTITIKPGLLLNLRQFARKHNRSMSDVIEEGLNRVIREDQEGSLETMYKGLFELRESMKDFEEDPKLADMSVDEILYGDPGAWNGTLREALGKKP